MVAVTLDWYDECCEGNFREDGEGSLRPREAPLSEERIQSAGCFALEALSRSGREVFPGPDPSPYVEIRRNRG